MNSSLSVPSSVRKSVTNFSQNLLFFPKILHSNRNLKTEKVMEADFPENLLITLKSTKRVQK